MKPKTLSILNVEARKAKMKTGGTDFRETYVPNQVNYCKLVTRMVELATPDSCSNCRLGCHGYATTASGARE